MAETGFLPAAVAAIVCSPGSTGTVMPQSSGSTATPSRLIAGFAALARGDTLIVSRAGFSDPQGLTEDGSSVYVADNNVIDKIAKSNGAATKLGAGATGNVWSVAYDSVTNRVFGAVDNTSGAGSIVSCPVGGAACSTLGLANQGRGFGIMLIGSTVYWVDGGNGSMGNTGGGLFSATAASLSNVQSLASSGTIYGFALALTSDDNFIYFTGGNSGDIYKCAIGGCSGTPAVIATGQGSARSILNDSSAVYWVNDAGQLLKVAK